MKRSWPILSGQPVSNEQFQNTSERLCQLAYLKHFCEIHFKIILLFAENSLWYFPNSSFQA
jgi:hypothetical protein